KALQPMKSAINMPIGTPRTRGELTPIKTSPIDFARCDGATHRPAIIHAKLLTNEALIAVMTRAIIIHAKLGLKNVITFPKKKKNKVTIISFLRSNFPVNENKTGPEIA